MKEPTSEMQADFRTFVLRVRKSCLSKKSTRPIGLPFLHLQSPNMTKNFQLVFCWESEITHEILRLSQPHYPLCEVNLMKLISNRSRIKHRWVTRSLSHLTPLCHLSLFDAFDGTLSSVFSWNFPSWFPAASTQLLLRKSPPEHSGITAPSSSNDFLCHCMHHTGTDIFSVVPCRPGTCYFSFCACAYLLLLCNAFQGNINKDWYMSAV